MTNKDVLGWRVMYILIKDNDSGSSLAKIREIPSCIKENVTLVHKKGNLTTRVNPQSLNVVPTNPNSLNLG